MERSRPDQLLDAWASVAETAVRPATSPRRGMVRSNLPGLSLAGGALLVAAVVVAAVWIGRPGSDDGIGAVPTVSPTPSATAEPTPAPSATPSASPTPTASPNPSPTLAPEDAFGTCAVADLTASITSWEGAAGSRIATVELTHAGSAKCWILSESRVQLLDADGQVIIDSGDPNRDVRQTVTATDRLTTMVRTSNYCGAGLTSAVTIAFLAPEGGTVAAPVFSPTDATIPPCNGPGQLAVMEMQPWTR